METSSNKINVIKGLGEWSLVPQIELSSVFDTEDFSSLTISTDNASTGLQFSGTAELSNGSNDDFNIAGSDPVYVDLDNCVSGLVTLSGKSAKGIIRLLDYTVLDILAEQDLLQDQIEVLEKQQMELVNQKVAEEDKAAWMESVTSSVTNNIWSTLQSDQHIFGKWGGPTVKYVVDNVFHITKAQVRQCLDSEICQGILNTIAMKGKNFLPAGTDALELGKAIIGYIIDKNGEKSVVKDIIDILVNALSLLTHLAKGVEDAFTLPAENIGSLDDQIKQNIKALDVLNAENEKLEFKHQELLTINFELISSALDLKEMIVKARDFCRTGRRKYLTRQRSGAAAIIALQAAQIESLQGKLTAQAATMSNAITALNTTIANVNTLGDAIVRIGNGESADIGSEGGDNTGDDSGNTGSDNDSPDTDLRDPTLPYIKDPIIWNGPMKQL